MAFYGLRSDSPDDAVEAEALVEYAAGLWTDPPEGFRADFRACLSDIDADRYAPLSKAGEGRFVLAERSYSYCSAKSGQSKGRNPRPRNTH